VVDLRDRPPSIGKKTIKTARHLVGHENSVLAIILIVLVAAVAVITKGKSVSAHNVRNVLFQITSRGISSIGQLFVILTGGIDLSVGGLAAFSLVLGGVMTLDTSQAISLPGIFPIMVLVGVGVGTLNGLSISRLGMPALIVTLAVWRITTGLSLNLTGTIGAIPIDSPLLSLVGRTAPAALVIVVAVAYLVLNRTSFGRSIYAVGGNPTSAWLSGINAKRIIFSTYVISGFLSGLVSVLVMSVNHASSIQGIGALELDTIAAVCVGGVNLAGGRGSVVGVILGVVIMGVINNALNLMSVSVYIQDIVKGAIIIGAVVINYLAKGASRS
jgi:ribose/xylose/arabinose/galactoside ABC-type transport system permease subunit